MPRRERSSLPFNSAKSFFSRKLLNFFPREVEIACTSLDCSSMGFYRLLLLRFHCRVIFTMMGFIFNVSSRM